MNINITVIVSLITAMAAIFAPSITAFINAKTQIKLKKLDLLYKTRLDTYQNFCGITHAYFNCWDIKTKPTKDEFLKIYQSAYLLASEKTRNKLENLKSYADKNNIEIKIDKTKLEPILLDINKSMSEDLENYL